MARSNIAARKESQGQIEKVTNNPRHRRCQRRLSVYLHTHVVLIIVCSLAILDAVCVIGQLISDILIMKEKLNYFEKIDEELTAELLKTLVNFNTSIHERWNLHAILHVLQGRDIHSRQSNLSSQILDTLSGHHLQTSTGWNRSPEQTSRDRQEAVSHLRFRRAVEVKVPGHEVDHGALYEVTHACHLGSLAILSLLLLETLLKVFAMGKKLKHHKLEIFDALVVTISWCLDVAFWEGIWAHPGTVAATYLIYLLPWRVVRIVNSFVLVIQEKEHVHLKIVKQRLRQAVKKSKEALDKASGYRHEVKALAGLCRKFGASESEITACSPSGKAGRRGSIQSVLERAASLTFISTLSNMGSVPSLFDIGDTSSEEEDQDSNHPGDVERVASHNLTITSAASLTTMESAHLDTNGHHGYQSDNSSGRSNRSEKDNVVVENEDAVADKQEEGMQHRGERAADMSAVGRTNSEDSMPPEYEVAVIRLDSDTRL